MLRTPLLLALLCTSVCAYAGRAYVSNEDGQTVSVIDTDTHQVVATIEVGKRPRGLKLHPDGGKLYVAVSGLPKCPPSVPDEECEKLEHDLAADGIAVIDTRALELEKVIKAGTDPEQFVITPDGKRLFVANEDASTASVVELADDTVVERIKVGGEPEGVGISPDGRWVLVTNESDNSVSIIDSRALEVVKTVKVGRRPRDVAFAPDGRTAYVGGEFDASVYRIGVPDGAPVEQIVQMRKEALPMTVILDPKRDRLYVSTGRGGTVAVIALEGDKARLVKEVPVGTRPWGMALTEDGRRLYTANGPSNNVSVVDTESLSVVATVPVGQSPWGVILGD